MYERLANLMKEQRITAYKLSQATGVTQATLSRWKSGKTSPSIETLQILADYFNVTVDYLLGNESKGLVIKRKTQEWVSDKKSRLFMCIDSGLLEALEAAAKENGITLEDAIENILYWDIQNRIDDHCNEQTTQTEESDIEAEVEAYRQELLAEKQVRTSRASTYGSTG